MYWLITIPPKKNGEIPFRFVVDDLSKVDQESFVAERIDVFISKVKL